jgi:PadR family transcriptional regulator PadR
MRRRSPNCGAEFCVLALLRDGERSSFDLVRALGNTEGLVTSKGTLYTLLGHLRREGMVQSTWRESASGPPRRYYRITQDGDAALQAFASQRQVPAEADRQPADARGGPGRPRSWPGASRCASTPRRRPPPRPAALIAARCSDNLDQSRDRTSGAELGGVGVRV